MKTMFVPLPRAVVHLRDGAVEPGNTALAQARDDLGRGRISGFLPVYIFEPAPGAVTPGWFHTYKRVAECHRLARLLRGVNLDLRITLGEPEQVLPALMVRLDARILYTTGVDPCRDETYDDWLEAGLRDFDVVSVSGIASRETGWLRPGWLGELDRSIAADEFNPTRLRSFMADPAGCHGPLDWLEVTIGLMHYFAEEELA